MIKSTSFYDKIAHLSGTKRSIIVWAMCLLSTSFFFYEYIILIQPSVMHTELASYFSITNASTWGTLIGAYYFTYTPMQIFSGAITDAFGPRKCLSAAAFICALGMLLFTITPYYYVAMMGRLLIGFGASFAFVGAMRLAVVWLPARRIALFSGLTLSIAMLGAVVGSSLIAELMMVFSGYTILLLSVAVGAILAVLLWWFVADDFQFSQTQSTGESSARQSILSGIIQVIQYRQIWYTGFVGCLIYVTYAAIGLLWGVPFLQVVYHFDHVTAAHLVAWIFIGGLVGTPMIGWLSDQLQNRKAPFLIGALANLVLLVIFIYYPIENLYIVTILLGLMGFFAGANALSFVIARECCSAKIAGTAISFVNMIVMLSGLIFQPVIGVLLDFFSQSTQPENGLIGYGVVDYQQAFSIMPIGLLISIVVGYYLIRR